MRFNRGALCAMIAALALGGCASATAGSEGGGGTAQVSPTGRTYEPGTAPRENAESRAATLALATSRYQEALTAAQAGMAADSTNPIFYYLAGEAAAGLEEFAYADSMWTIAERIYPAYELDIEPSRENAWITEFNRGISGFNAGDLNAAEDAWASAHRLYKLRPNAVQNLGVVLTQLEQYDEAIQAYEEGLANLDLEPATREIEPEEVTEREEAREFMESNLVMLLLHTEQWAAAETMLRRVVTADPNNVEAQANLAAALSGQGRDDEATQLYTRLLTMPNLGPNQLFNIGVTLFNSGQSLEAGQAFGRVTELNPNHRDAWYNQANALYDAEAWEEVVSVAPRHRQVEPLSQTAGLIQARAYRELDQNDEALAILTQVETMPVWIEDMQISAAGDGTSVSARVEGNAAEPGTPITLRFTFYNDGGQEVTSETVTFNAPAREESTNIEVRSAQPASSYKYEVVS